MERVVFERMAELDQEHWWFVARRRILASLIDRVVRPPEDARILEVGCGTGHNLEMLGRFGRLDACELDDVARELAGRRLGRAVLSAKLPDLGMFAADSYDSIALLDVLEHVPDDSSALAAIRSRLRPGGALLVTVPANPWMWSAHDVAHHHFRRYTRRTLEHALKESGLEIQYLSYFNSLLFPLIAGARLVGKALGRESADDSMPPAPVNSLLDFAFGLEAPLIGRVSLPFGVSLVAVARRPSA